MRPSILQTTGALLVLSVGSIGGRVLQTGSGASAEIDATRKLALERAARFETGEALALLDGALASKPGDGRLLSTRGKILWGLRRARSAIEALEQAARDPKALGDANYELGRVYFFKGWQAEGAFPGWHDEPEYRERAIAAFEAAIKADQSRSEPRIALGDALILSDSPSDALAAYDAAIAASPTAMMARVGRWRALKALNRAAEIRSEVAAATEADDVRMLAAAREGYLLIDQEADAKQVERAILERFTTSAPAARFEAERIAAARQAKQYPTVVDNARAFAKKFPDSPQLIGVYDALIEAYAADSATDPTLILDTINARIRMRPDPAVYLTGGNALAARRALLDEVIRLAEAAIPASETFINENLGSYKMQGKVQGSLGRSRAAATDLMGWAYLLKGETDKAATRLEEAERLSRGLDMANQFHLGELARSKEQLQASREYYLSALTLAQGPPAVRGAEKASLAEVYAKLGNDPAEFEAYLKDELGRRHDARRTALLQSMVDRKVPDVTLTDVSGKTVNLAAMRGKVLLLNFFSSW